MWPRVIIKQPKFDSEPDLYVALGVGSDVTPREADRAYRDVLNKTLEYEQVPHLAWKVLRDPWYAELYKNHRSLEYLYEAGFFVDKITLEDVNQLEFTPGLATTPFHKILNNLTGLKQNETPVVLVTTGGFSPIHHGHIAMMEVAKKELKKRGYSVVGGYFSPSHDDYVSTKYGGEAELSSDHRVYLSQLAVQYSDWLMVDPWESRFVNTDINFTDVFAHLKSYLNYYIKHDTPIEVFYVFGGDNAKFTRVFKEHGGCVCIAREDYLKLEVQYEDGIKNNSRIIFTQNLSSHANTSSTIARKWKINLMPEEVSSVYFKWRKNILLAQGMVAKPMRLYVLRDEGSWAIESWMKKFGAAKVLTAKEKFREQLVRALQGVFLHVLLPDLPVQVEVRVYQLEDQINYVEQLGRQEQVLNLDMCTNRGAGINLSRLFYLCDGQLRPSQLVGRPGFSDIDSQIGMIHPGEYTLLDDDIATGSTINMLMGTLPENITIKKMRTLMDYSRSMYARQHPGSLDQDAFDVVDLRDFLLGSKAAGLVVSLPDGQMVRAPYLQPYISLVSRASIPPSSEMVLSKKLWELNLEFFSNFESLVLISDLDEYVQKLFLYLGFPATMPIADLCRWHLDKIYAKRRSQ